VNAAPERLLAGLVAAPEGLAPHAAGATVADRLAARSELERRGHDIRTAGDRWILTCAARHFDPARFARCRRTGLGGVIEVWERTHSTNDLAWSAAGAALDTVWLAEEQTGGRGRQGRTWSCAAHEGLLVSFGVPWAQAPDARPTLLPVAVGLGLCEGLSAATGLEARVKWPNDIWVGGRKIAGVLVEARHEGRGHAVAGLGINTGDATRGLDLATATTLAAEGVAIARETLLAVVLEAVERRVAAWRMSDFDSILVAWRRVDALFGRTIEVECDSGPLVGRVAGLTPLGLLRLDLAGGGWRELAAGEVHLR